MPRIEDVDMEKRLKHMDGKLASAYSREYSGVEKEPVKNKKRSKKEKKDVSSV